MAWPAKESNVYIVHLQNIGVSMSEAYLVIQNFIDTIEEINPTESTLSSRGFLNVDPIKLNPESTQERSFSVLWTDSSGDYNSTDINARQADHTIMVEIYYNVNPKGYDWYTVQKLILRDRDDLITALRHPDSYDYGIQQRYRTADELERSDNIWTLRMEWRTTIFETEA